MEQTECSETSAYKIQTPGNYPEENIQHAHLLLIAFLLIFNQTVNMETVRFVSISDE
jgi:hypothetical protein